jgi:peptide/nickel transport system substrate-binding protein
LAKYPHSKIPELLEDMKAGRLDRREFLRFATLLGLSVGAAYSLSGLVSEGALISEARADELPKGGNLRIGMRCQEIKNPHASDFVERTNVIRQVCEYLTITAQDNITRPYLLEKWDVSDDLKTWTLTLRKGIKWHSGRPLTADDVVWNLKRVSDPASGSSVLGLFTGYLVQEVDAGEKDKDGKPKKTSKLWSDNAIEKVDDQTVRLNAFAPQIAVPEHLFHYPMFILDPAENGVFGVGSNGTGPFELVEYTVGSSGKLKARTDYWGKGPYLSTLEYVDLGDNPGAAISAMASKQVDGLHEADAIQVNAMKNFPDVVPYQATTAQTGVARMRQDHKPFDDPRVRMAMKLAVDRGKVIQASLLGAGIPAEDHHVAPIHPEYAKLPERARDVAKAKELLKEAGFPDGFDTEIVTRPDPAWEINAVQALVEQFKEVGIRAAIKPLPGAQYWDVWDKAPFSFTGWGHRPLGIMVLALAYRTGAVWNESGYSNKEFDELLTQAEGTLDVEKRRAIMAKIEAVLQEDGPIAQPFWRTTSTVMDKKVKGFTQHPSQYIFAQELAVTA